MLHFTEMLDAVDRPQGPPVCPKCGSHRTEVIGNHDVTQRIVRCNVCGAISTVAVAGTTAIPSATTNATSAA